MECRRIGNAIVCGPRPRPKRCSVCGGPKATQLCDWKVGPKPDAGAQPTCDAPLCLSCTKSPAPGKDLCPKHAAAWERLRRARGQLEALNAEEDDDAEAV